MFNSGKPWRGGYSLAVKTARTAGSGPFFRSSPQETVFPVHLSDHKYEKPYEKRGKVLVVGPLELLRSHGKGAVKAARLDSTLPQHLRHDSEAES
jgi:hypothetical protein